MHTIRDPRPNALSTLGAFDTLFDRVFASPLTQPPGLSRDLRPAVNIAEDREALYFEVELPGFQKDQIQLEVEDGRLNLRAERKLDESREGLNYRQLEHRYGMFTRSFKLPRGVDTDRVTANYTDGLLRITLPKREPAAKNTIQIEG